MSDAQFIQVLRLLDGIARHLGCGPDGGSGPILTAIADLKATIMTLQEKIDAYAAAVEDGTTAITDSVGHIATAVTDLTAEIAALKAVNPTVDTTNLEAKLAALTTATGTLKTGTQALTDLDAANPPTP